MADEDDRQYVRPPEPADIGRICRALNESGAKYVLIGGFALIAHGGLRTTKDVDLLIDDAPENVARVRAALCVLPDRAAREVADDDVRNYTVVRIADEVLVDLLGKACGLAYADVVQDAETVEIAGVPVTIASKATLIRTKMTIRPQDAADRAFLQQRIDESA